ncbi:cellulose binding domain-containing protein [Paractinoplanes rishiriensis]|uniref:Rhamnogalacturonan lyase n=1 Tax=Paractinoplanes rishiriensis TaxID=1050105 RepID=A0A919MYR6_9ACTN|nr:cellulose binding domain-containing protein [Actinoplanes rishiriensis]GIE97370.1 rhamnogalacturonan lyase [Actinoplanes rishiriensis]
MANRKKFAAAALAVSTVGAGLVLVATRADAAAGCQVNYTVSNSWPGGFGVAVDVTNLGDPINGWTLTFAFPGSQTISSLWNGSVTQSGANVSVKDAGWNGSLATNASTSFGFNGSGDAATPASFSLNGTVCTGGVAPTTGPTTPPTTAPTTPPTTGPTTPPTTGPTTPPTTSPPATGPVTIGGKQLERLDRGVVSVRSGSGNLVTWRLLGNDPSGVAFNVYRGSTKVNASPITASTNYLDSGAAAGQSYSVRPVVGGVEQAADGTSLNFANGYLDVPIQNPNSSLYTASDASAGDLDGDGKPDIVLKWEPNNAKDNSQSGVTDVVYIDGYKLDGTRLWRINLGRNIRAGAHYTQFQVYDYDGDGDAEVAMKTADGTVSGTGQVIGSSSADYRNSSGYVLTGPEFLTMFDGRNGAALSTVNYEPPRGTVSSWGDSYGNRVDRFLAGTAYLDGARPSVIMARGYYTRAVVVAWDFRNGSLTRRWTYDSGNSNVGAYGQGNHNLSIADTDADGKDEVIYGAAAINDNGSLMWRSGLGHGDALHVGDFIPSRAGLEVYRPSESTSQPTDAMLDGRTGAVIWSHASCGCDNGRAVAADIYAGSAGAEAWSSSVSQLSNGANGAGIGRKPSSSNFVIWWDGDAQRELLDQTRIDKYGTGSDTNLLSASGVHSNNGTKATPSLSGDILGDWREEVIWPTSSNTALRIYSTPVQTDRKVVTLLHDPQYRAAIAWQNTAYNQPPHPSFAIH